MVIAKVEKKPVTSASEAREAVEKGALDKGILLQVKTPAGGSAYVLLKADTEK
jgi:hypothetical protein